jgi:hypothetical protein
MSGTSNMDTKRNPHPEGTGSDGDCDIQDDSEWVAATNQAREGVRSLMKLADDGDRFAREELRTISIMIARHLNRCHPSMIREVDKFPVVISGNIEVRKVELKACADAPIGERIGFPRAGKTKSPVITGKTPTAYWRAIQEWIDSFRSLADAAGGNITVQQIELLPVVSDVPDLAITDEWLKQIAALPNFGTGDRDKWFEAGTNLVEANPDVLIPLWIVDRVHAGKKSRGAASKAEEELKKGFGYCWPKKKPPKIAP